MMNSRRARHSPPIPDSVDERVREGLCTQCGTCAALCPRDAVSMMWHYSIGWEPKVDRDTCTSCGICLAVCPAQGFDYSAISCDEPDFIGPFRRGWFGWAADPAVRYAGASGGVGTALVQGAMARDLIDAAILTRMSPRNPSMAEPFLATTPEEVATARGSKYNPVVVASRLHTVFRRPGRYALVGLPCHIQGLRLAQQRSRLLRERVVLAIGIFCGLTATPRAIAVATRRAGIDPGAVQSVTYRGPDWPGGMHLGMKDGTEAVLPYPDYFDRFVAACVPPRCRLCPDALADAADVSIGDAWLPRFYTSTSAPGRPGVSDVIARTEIGERVVRGLAPEWLTLEETDAQQLLASQSAVWHIKRPVCRGRLSLWRMAGRPVPEYPGLDLTAKPSDLLAAAVDVAQASLLGSLGKLRYR